MVYATQTQISQLLQKLESSGLFKEIEIVKSLVEEVQTRRLRILELTAGRDFYRNQVDILNDYQKDTAV